MHLRERTQYTSSPGAGWDLVAMKGREGFPFFHKLHVYR